ncbi:nucleotide exchange factor GrpE, partial [Candidatus Saccharibacteria bacterium]|nr:nucleotide exchange factor GrpE [Candidatus Saccharibacteria bacterium]
RENNQHKTKNQNVSNNEMLQQQLADLTEALQRERADAENIRKRAESDRIAALATGKEIAVGQLVPLIDNLHRAFAHMPAELDDNKWAQGVKALDKQLESLMTEFGLEVIETVGKDFDPELMEAVAVEEGGNGHEVVSEELQRGYRLNGRVIRVAMVKVTR